MQLQDHLKTHMASVLQTVKVFCAILNRTWAFATTRPESVVLNQPVLCGMSMEEHPCILHARRTCLLGGHTNMHAMHINIKWQHGMVHLVKHELIVWT